MLNVLKRSIMALAIITLGCKKSDPRADADMPCSGFIPFKATATINEVIEGTNRVVPVDTIVNFQALLLGSSNATTESVTYEWLVSNRGGQPTSYKQPSLLLRFGPDFIGERIDVKLIARRGGVPACSNEDNLDTVQRSFFIYTNNKADTVLNRPFIKENRIVGRWQGAYTDQPGQPFVVTVADFGFSPTIDSVSHYGVRLFNMPEGCGNRPSWASNPCTFAILPSSYSHPIEYGGNSFTVYQPYTSDCDCKPVSLYGFIPYGQRDSLVIDVDFYQQGTGTVARTRQWKGKRI
jgi:hypothetical protein